ncbi:hypothetical protein [Mangrovihabitans endophyticus]|uniref:PIN domain-containing protein n=1 Tax=Mangrovihabitans endophyticus TaxID=1751298 RepID=A0A8J3FP38_9ACTN|nr:hypothetical protein [Mangrovihabitans endophyticus]GGK89589.1 hypothetical protein GCM10012284_24380 [Mangrovihabitans endophyticus]
MIQNEPAREIRAVLDRSALQSYARGHVHVGELLREIAEEKNMAVAIPAAALAEAHAEHLADQRSSALLGLILTLPVTAVLDLDHECAVAMAGPLSLTGNDMARAQAVWAANKHGALLFTTEQDKMRALVPEKNILPLPDQDA